MLKNVLSFDFGASTGRAVLGKYNGSQLEIEEVHRFENKPIMLEGTLCWDIDMLFHEVKQVLKKVCKEIDVSSVAIDTWGVDFGLLNKAGELISSPVHYRDARTDGMSEEVNKFIPLDNLYEKTGNQVIFFNTIFQLAYINKYKKEWLDETDSLLLMPDLFNYLLTGEKRAEETIASTTQLFDPYNKTWNEEVIQLLRLPTHIFKEVIRPGTVVGYLSKKLAEELAIPEIPVVATTSHDTASAVVSVPAPKHEFLFVSSGTWSLIGTELNRPIISQKSTKYNITNESGVSGTTRFLKNVTGLWILQETKREFASKGKHYSYDDITKLAEEAKAFTCLIDVDHLEFQKPGNMPEKIKQYAKRTNQAIPKTDGELFRLIYESLALKYRQVFEEIMDCVEKQYDKVHIVGGGSQAEMLCQMIADASGKEVIAGPVEATVIGNSLVQLVSQDIVKDISEARDIVKQSFSVTTYQPQEQKEWKIQYDRFQEILNIMEETEREW